MNQVCIGANWAVLGPNIHGSELVVIVSIKPATTAQSLSLKLAPISQLCKPRFDLHSNWPTSQTNLQHYHKPLLVATGNLCFPRSRWSPQRPQRRRWPRNVQPRLHSTMNVSSILLWVLPVFYE